jgi:hypothetical protein
MVRTLRQLIVLLAGLAVCTGITITAAGAAQAAPKPAPMSVHISGDQLGQPLVIRAEADAAMYAAVFDQVSWMRGAGQAKAPSSDDLGLKYTVVVLSGDAAKQTFDLYPFAKGGPRACRPGKQPDQRSTAPAWFYGRLNMPETLRAAGVPLAEQADTVSGGIGGGERVTPDDRLDPGRDVDRVLGDLQRLLLLNAGVVIAITMGLAGIALLVRRRTR